MKRAKNASKTPREQERDFFRNLKAALSNRSKKTYCRN